MLMRQEDFLEVIPPESGENRNDITAVSSFCCDLTLNNLRHSTYSELSFLGKRNSKPKL